LLLRLFRPAGGWLTGWLLSTRLPVGLRWAMRIERPKRERC